MDADFSAYTDAELEQALDGVNRDKYPEILARLLAEKAARESAPLSRPKPDSTPSGTIANYASYSDVELEQALVSVNGEKYPKIEQALRAEKAERDRRGADVSVQTFADLANWQDSPVHSAAESEPWPDSIAEENAASLSAAHPADQAANQVPASSDFDSTAGSVAPIEATSLNPVWAKRVALYILITAPMPLINSIASLAFELILIALLFAGLSVAAGIGVLNNKSWGINACIAILALQLIRVTASGVTISIMSALGLYLYVGDGGDIGFSLVFNPHAALFIDMPGTFIGINLLSIVMIAVLVACRRGSKQ